MQANEAGTELKEVAVMWSRLNSSKCIKFTFNGHLHEEEALEAVNRWKTDFSNKLEEDEKVIVVCDCLKMKGYDTNARKAWQSTISELKNNIAELWVISDNALIRTAAKTMGLITKFKIKTVSSEEEICKN